MIQAPVYALTCIFADFVSRLLRFNINFGFHLLRDDESFVLGAARWRLRLQLLLTRICRLCRLCQIKTLLQRSRRRRRATSSSDFLRHGRSLKQCIYVFFFKSRSPSRTFECFATPTWRQPRQRDYSYVHVTPATPTWIATSHPFPLYFWIFFFGTSKTRTGVKNSFFLQLSSNILYLFLLLILLLLLPPAHTTRRTRLGYRA